MNYKVIVLLFVAQLGFSQETITKNIGDFDTVKVFDKISVQLIPSDENKIEISGDKNSDVEIINKNGELKIRMSFGKMLSGEDINVLLYFTNLENIEANEGATISSSSIFKQISLGINAKEGSQINLKIDVQKASIRAASGGIIEVEGLAQNQDIIITSGGELNAKNLETSQTTISINAGGNANIRASELVDAKVRAGGTITIFGNPKQINQKTVLGGTIVESNQ
jgi:hypothetical protein